MPQPSTTESRRRTLLDAQAADSDLVRSLMRRVEHLQRLVNVLEQDKALLARQLARRRSEHAVTHAPA